MINKCISPLLVACAAITCLLGSITSPVHAATLPAGFSESIVLSGLTEPTAIRFSPDGRVFVAEKSGLIKVFANLSATTPTVFHDLRTNVHNFWDRGLMGLELHPNFPTVPSVYVLYTYNKDPNNSQVPRWAGPDVTSDPCPTPPGATTDGCVVSGRLSRLEASTGSNVSTGTESVLVEGWGQQFPSHSMDTVMFGADGALYASAGDGASFTFADYGQAGNPLNPLGDPPVGIGGVQTPPTAEGGATRAQSLRRVSGPAVLNGTLIRVDPFTGAGLSDNPLFSSADPNARRIVGYGFRNPFRFTFRPGTSEVWIGDVGWSAWEEIDRIPNPLTPTVSNFGWPCYEGAAQQPSFQALGLNICKSLYTSGSATPPYFAYAALQPVVAGETCPATSGSSISGLAFNSGGTYPASYQGALFFADHSRNCIWSMLAGANGLPNPANIQTFVAGAANPVDLQIGPGGDLFYVDFDGGTIRRIQYTSGNQAPNAVIQATPLSGPAPLTVTFDGRASSDPNAGDTLTYSWDLNGDGSFGDALTAQTSFTYTQAKLYNVQLKVTDNQGAFDVVRVLISAGNSPPTAFIDAPVANTQWQVGQSITFSGHATDPNETLPPSAFFWEVILHHCPSNCHTHPIQSFSGVTTASFAAPDHPYYSYLEVKLTVTDAGGLTGTTSVFLDPQTVTLNFASTPSGLQLVVGSSSSPTPFPRTVILGSANSVSAGTPQTLGGTTYYFASWSDGGNQSHLIVGTASVTYAATYSLTLPADITPPTAPATLTASPISGTQFTLSWPAATDNLGVTGYQVERCQGVGCTTFALIASPTTSYRDTGLTPGTSYSYRVRAQDATGNLSPYSPIITATTGGAPAGGLVAAYGFNEGTGITSSDASGNNNTARLNTAIWAVQGKFGMALFFDGTSKVTVPDAPSLDLTTGMTLEAWVYPTVAGGGNWPTIMMKETPPNAPYMLYGKVWSPTGPALPGMRAFTTVGQNVSGGSQLPANTWSHFAGTYDGTTLRVYLNGTQIASLAATGALANSTGLLSIGGNSLSSIEYFTGLLDEIRIYNRALSASEIQQDMTTPVGGSPADTTPPSTPSSLTASVVSGTQINLSWPAATDNLGVTGYQVERCQGAGCTTFALIASPPTTGYLDTGLTAGTTYSYRIRARDAVGNLSGNSIIATATTGGAPAGGLVAAYGFNEGTGITSSDASGNNNTASLNTAIWATQGKFGMALFFDGTSKVTVPDAPSLDLTTGMTLEAWVYPTVAGGGDWPTIMMKEAPPNPPYVLYGKVWSPTGPVLPGMRAYTTAAYVVSGGSVLPANTWSHFAGTYDGTTLRVYLNGTQIASLAATGALANSTGLLSIGGNSGSSIEYFRGLLDEIRIYNRALSASEIQQDMTTPVGGSPADTTPPSPPSSLTASVVSGTQITLSWPAATDNIGVTGYQVERCQGAGCTTFALLASPTTTSYSDTGLTAGTTYSYRIRARDAVGNLSGNSIIATATTGGAPAGGLVAAYGFNEGTGITSSDASGNNNTASLNTAIWASRASLAWPSSSDGTSKVTVPDAPSLDLTTGMTLEAWVYPTVAGGGDWPTIMMKEAPPNPPYVLYGRVWSPTTALPGMRTFTTVGQAVSGGSQLPREYLEPFRRHVRRDNAAGLSQWHADCQSRRDGRTRELDRAVEHRRHIRCRASEVF